MDLNYKSNTKHDIVVTIDSNYIEPLKIMLFSLRNSNPNIKININLIYSQITPDEIKDLRYFMKNLNMDFAPYFVDDDLFKDAPTTMHYTKAMYYRLLAYKILPKDMKKALYLDPDILIINSIAPLYDADISKFLFGACSHSNSAVVDNINKVRLQNSGLEKYYNSGVLLLNLEAQRKEVKSQAIFEYVKNNEMVLFLPDQDVLNGLYGNRILELDDTLFNYDVRKYRTYYVLSNGVKDVEWVTKNTVILHFCGKQKPWKTKYVNRFGLLYKHYKQLTHRLNGGKDL